MPNTAQFVSNVDCCICATLALRLVMPSAWTMQEVLEDNDDLMCSMLGLKCCKVSATTLDERAKKKLSELQKKRKKGVHTKTHMTRFDFEKMYRHTARHTYSN